MNLKFIKNKIYFNFKDLFITAANFAGLLWICKSINKHIHVQHLADNQHIHTFKFMKHTHSYRITVTCNLQL